MPTRDVVNDDSLPVERLVMVHDYYCCQRLIIPTATHIGCRRDEQAPPPAVLRCKTILQPAGGIACSTPSIDHGTARHSAEQTDILCG